jgi:hypothetical protein
VLRCTNPCQGTDPCACPCSCGLLKCKTGNNPCVPTPCTCGGEAGTCPCLAKPCPTAANPCGAGTNQAPHCACQTPENCGGCAKVCPTGPPLCSGYSFWCQCGGGQTCTCLMCSRDSTPCGGTDPCKEQNAVGCGGGETCGCGSVCKDGSHSCPGAVGCSGATAPGCNGGQTCGCGDVCISGVSLCGGSDNCASSDFGCMGGETCGCPLFCMDGQKPCPGSVTCATNATKGCNVGSGNCDCGLVCEDGNKLCAGSQQCICVLAWVNGKLAYVNCGIEHGGVDITRNCPNQCSSRILPAECCYSPCPHDTSSPLKDCDCNCNAPVWPSLARCDGSLNPGGPDCAYGVPWQFGHCGGESTLNCCGGCLKVHPPLGVTCLYLNCRYLYWSGNPPVQHCAIDPNCADHCPGLSNSTCSRIASCSCTSGQGVCEGKYTCEVCLGLGQSGAGHNGAGMYTSCAPGRCVGNSKDTW